MKTLVFDTSLDKMYVGLADNGIVLDSKVVETTKEHYHSAFLISTITNILKENNLTPQDIEVVGTNVGPGSFTGIRACTTVARVFAQGIDNIKAVGVSSLEILSKINPANKSTLVALDARKDMAYVAIYDNGQEVLAPKTILLDELKGIISKNDYFIITDDKLEPILGGISYQKQSDNLGEYLLVLANQKIKDGGETNWRKLLPLYIQPPPANCKVQKTA